MIECPDCQTVFKGVKCHNCGYIPKSNTPVNQVEYRERMRKEAELTQQARDWLNHHRITTPEMSKPERMKACADYRKKVKTSMRLSEVEPKAWANSLKSDYLDGVQLHIVQIDNASAALGEVWKDGQCFPRGAE